jgi:acetyl esterase/lipase
MAIPSARRTGLETWSVDNRLPPDPPFPAALDDGLGVEIRKLLTARFAS